MDFLKLKQSVAKQFAMMSAHTLYRTTAPKDVVWETYLASFPAGTNPMFRKRSEYDCSCCKNFIRTIGNVVAIIDGKMVSIWDGEVNDPNFKVICRALSSFVKTMPIENQFFHTEKTVGTDKNFEQVVGQAVTTWNHFHVNLPTKFVLKGADVGPKLGELRALHDVLLRGLSEITSEAIQSVLELIAQNSLYRGEEQKYAVTEFKKLQTKFKNLPNSYEQDWFVWNAITTVPVSVSKMRNTSIGTLLTDLSEGYDLEDAVKSFEAKVAPANYKRPTALVTKKMVENAKAKIDELGLTSALERRYATLDDLNINNILYADRSAKKAITGDVFDSITTKAVSKTFDKVEQVPIDKFLKDIVPNATLIEIMPDNSHIGNLMSLIAPADPTANNMFKWNNGFSWSYSGDVADSIKERVKAAGGNVTGDFCCRLAWYNHDDLDLHMVETFNGRGSNEIYFRQKISPHTKGQLDVDMNAGGGTTRTPVENIFYGNINNMVEGTYKLFVHQWAKRETKDVGFEVEIDIKGTTYNYVHQKQVPSDARITVAEFVYTKKDGLKLVTDLKPNKAAKSVWNINTNTFQKVSAIMLSPNYWDGVGVGNKHYFFMLDGCRNDGTARGFYNEFLRADLDPHRKVIEMVGAKMRTDESNNQLSGLGFSSTQRNSMLCRVTGSFTRVINVTF